jgi:2-polyprenyl-6-hydroxyphenyl methylase/3-demethylubiquinone-9 3-methyltransferase
VAIDNDIYNRLGDSWWEEGNPLSLLHGSCTAGRMAYFRSVLQENGPGCAGMTALDIGCGCGFLSEEFARLGWEVTGLDPSEVALAAARRHAAAGGLDIRYLAGRGEQLPFPDAGFDLVYCCDVLEHVADLQAVIAETARVLKPGGLYLFDTINRTAASRILAIWLLQEWPLTRLANTPLHDWAMFIRPDELSGALRSNSLAPADITGLAPRAGKLSMLRNLLAARRGRISFGELSRRLDFGQVKSTAVSYMGFAVKSGGPRRD